MNQILASFLSIGAVRKAAEITMRKNGSSLYLGLVIHCERIFETETFEKLLAFSKIAPKKATLCVMTPENPFIQFQIEKAGLDRRAFDDRLKRLSEDYEIGFHGHWCRKGGGGQSAAPKGGRSAGVERFGFKVISDDPAEVRKQFVLENNYLNSLGIKPKVYSAGWWYLDESIVKLLDEFGYSADCSVRYGLPNFFGGTYLDASALPQKGLPFYLAPSNNIIEFTSISYMNFNWWSLAKDLFKPLNSSEGPLFVTVPIHDYSLPEDMDKVTANINFLSTIKNCHWSSVSEMHKMAAAERTHVRKILEP
jgi:hypothetical protein